MGREKCATTSDADKSGGFKHNIVEAENRISIVGPNSFSMLIRFEVNVNRCTTLCDIIDVAQRFRST